MACDGCGPTISALQEHESALEDQIRALKKLLALERQQTARLQRANASLAEDVAKASAQLQIRNEVEMSSVERNKDFEPGPSRQTEPSPVEATAENAGSYEANKVSDAGEHEQERFNVTDPLVQKLHSISLSFYSNIYAQFTDAEDLLFECIPSDDVGVKNRLIPYSKSYKLLVECTAKFYDDIDACKPTEGISSAQLRMVRKAAVDDVHRCLARADKLKAIVDRLLQ